jgi:hypothetical protein
MLPPIKGGCDIVFVARTKTVRKKSTDIFQIMERELRSAGVIE